MNKGKSDTRPGPDPYPQRHARLAKPWAVTPEEIGYYQNNPSKYMDIVMPSITPG